MLKHSGKAALLRAPLPDFPDTAACLPRLIAWP